MGLLRVVTLSTLFTLVPYTVAYPAIGEYMPVSNVVEHSQMSFDVEVFMAKLNGDTPDYAGAKAIYQNGGGNSCKSATQPRTLEGFATADLSSESFGATYEGAGLEATFWDTWMLSALDGTGDFTGLSNTKRVTCLKKGVLGLMTYYASHELESGISKASVESTRSDTGSGHAWDEGWAFYYGASPDGKDSPWEVSMKRDGDFPDGAKVQTAIVPHFNKGLISVRNATYNANDAVEARDTIYRMWAITYLRAALKYLMIAELNYDEKAHSEGYAYYLPIHGWIHSKNSDVADLLLEKLAITQTSILSGSYCEAKTALEAAYPAIGINCSMMGIFVSDSINSIACDTPCTDSAVSLPEGARSVAAVDGEGADVNCTAATLPSTSEPASETSAASCLPGLFASLAWLSLSMLWS